MNVTLIASHSKTVTQIARKYGWLPGARYTNLRDIRTFRKIGLIDIDWKHYCFERHLIAVKKTKPLFTVARDIERIRDLELIMEQATILKQFAKYVIIVPKDKRIQDKLREITRKGFILGYSVPTKYGKTAIDISYFRGPVHLLGGRPDVQRELANSLDVISVDCNRFTIDAAFGDYFNGSSFIRHPEGGYVTCLRESIKNITKIWKAY